MPKTSLLDNWPWSLSLRLVGTKVSASCFWSLKIYWSLHQRFHHDRTAQPSSSSSWRQGSVLYSPLSPGHHASDVKQVLKVSNSRPWVYQTGVLPRWAICLPSWSPILHLYVVFYLLFFGHPVTWVDSVSAEGLKYLLFIVGREFLSSSWEEAGGHC